MSAIPQTSPADITLMQTCIANRDKEIATLRAELAASQGGHKLALESMDLLRQSLSELDAKCDRLKEAWEAINALQAKEWQRAEAAEAELASVRGDAGRYRWLRSQNVGPVYIEAVLFETISDDHSPPYRSLKHTTDLDAAIDAAISAEEDAIDDLFDRSSWPPRSNDNG
jgi:hypothetical protein